MCGIAGVYDLGHNPISDCTISKMTEALAHRGPDGSGLYVHQNLALGHRRLAVLDQTEKAAQPMSSPDNRFILTYNGEIYNYSEIRFTLKKKGYRFRSSGDTEVLLFALIEWGKEALLRLNGMFAFAFFDREHKTLLLARDRYGIKPLYYSQFKNKFVFASEIRAILEHPDFEKKLNIDVIPEYFTFQNILTDNTFVRGVHLLQPGHLITVQNGKHNISIEQYWDFEFADSSSSKIKPTDYPGILRDLMIQSVNRQKVSDTEIGAYLSGGIDSGIIATLAGGDLKTFTCGFDLASVADAEKKFDERQKAELVSTRIGSEHYEVILNAKDMENSLNSVVNAIEDLKVGQCYPNFFAAKLASKFVKVCFSGIGGDELFGGYPWRYYVTDQKQNKGDFIKGYYSTWQRLLTKNEYNELMKVKNPSNKSDKAFEIFSDTFKNFENKQLTQDAMLNMCLYFEAKTFLHSLLNVEDKLSMSQSLETRVPFLDNSVVDFALECPIALKLNLATLGSKVNENDLATKQRLSDPLRRVGKSVLRKSFEGQLPKFITNGDKQGFSAPDATWFRNQSENFVTKKLNSNDARICDYVDRNKMNELILEHNSGKQNRRLLIWSLLCFEELLQTFS